MLKLFYAPYACSISPHIALREAGVAFDLDRVDFKQGKMTSGGKLLKEINPKGYVPALLLDNGELLTEGAVIVQYIADLNPQAHLAPAQGTFERVRLQEWLNYIATELHKGLSPLFSAQANEEYKSAVKEKVATRLAFVEARLDGRKFLFGDQFTVADGYMFYAMRAWHRATNSELSTRMKEYYAHIVERPAVIAALQAEGIQ